MKVKVLILIAMMMSGPAYALDLVLSGASQTKSEKMVAGSVRLPTAPWSPDVRAPSIEGDIERTVFRSPGGTRTTLQLLAPLRDQLSGAGFDTVFACSDRTCGGFDFRLEMDLLGPPEMFVDLGDFRYLLMSRESGTPHTVSIVTSRSDGAGFVHVTKVSDATLAPLVPDAIANPGTTDTQSSDQQQSILTLLEREGRVVLGDLDFESGSATLGSSTYDSLAALADWLSENEGARIALVGHTDNVGNSASNTLLSQRRADTVRSRLIEEAGIAPDRIEAAGVGYLAPLASNATEEGRAFNRRVEAVILTTP